MPSGWNNMDNKYDEQLLIMKDMIESNRQDPYEKTKKLTEDLKAIITSLMDWIKISKSLPDRKD